MISMVLAYAAAVWVGYICEAGRRTPLFAIVVEVRCGVEIHIVMHMASSVCFSRRAIRDGVQ